MLFVKCDFCGASYDTDLGTTQHICPDCQSHAKPAEAPAPAPAPAAPPDLALVETVTPTSDFAKSNTHTFIFLARWIYSAPTTYLFQGTLEEARAMAQSKRKEWNAQAIDIFRVPPAGSDARLAASGAVAAVAGRSGVPPNAVAAVGKETSDGRS